MLRWRDSLCIYVLPICLLLIFSPSLVQAQSESTAAKNPLLDHNLLRNGDAEEETNTLWAPGWKPEGTLQVAAYGQISGEWEKGVQGAPKGGCCYFRLEWQNKNVSQSAFQEIDLTGLTDDIDSGRVWAKLSGYLGGLMGGSTETNLSVTWLDAFGKQIAVNSTTASPWNLRRPFVGIASLIPQEQKALVPRGARKAIVRLSGESAGDAYGYTALADNLSFVLSEQPTMLN
jgi:hypothetical protein